VDFVTSSDAKPGAWAAIGDLKDAAKILTGVEGTLVTRDVSTPGGVVWRERTTTPETKRKPSKEPHRYG